MDTLKMILILTSLMTSYSNAFPTVMRKNKPNFAGIPSLAVDIIDESLCIDDASCKTEGYKCNKALPTWQCQQPCNNRRDCRYGMTCDVEQGFCGAPKTFDDILNKQGCPKIHKQPCATNTDCACADAEYVCEKELFSTKKECVSKKPIHEQKKKQEGETCRKNSDCEELFYACVDGTCQVDFSSFGEDSSFMENLFGKNAVKKEKQKS
ncbi:uncharacterized protein [Clytia hemisphaerica]|uniref:Dickkopf protein n=1 Tax=Clytia hemisphaerica TaxID=252671 RepID=A0A7M5VD34_9CNID